MTSSQVDTHQQWEDSREGPCAQSGSWAKELVGNCSKYITMYWKDCLCKVKGLYWRPLALDSLVVVNTIVWPCKGNPFSTLRYTWSSTRHVSSCHASTLQCVLYSTRIHIHVYVKETTTESLVTLTRLRKNMRSRRLFSFPNSMWYILLRIRPFFCHRHSSLG